MTQALEQLTAGASCWATDAAKYAKQATREIASLGHRDAAHLVCRGTTSAAEASEFQQWLAAHATLNRVEVRDVGEHGNGLVALQPLHEGDSFVSIPYSTILSADASLGSSTNESQWSQVAQDPLLTRFPSCRLALRVLSEACQKNKGKNSSFYGPYLAMLPRTFDIPLFYDESDWDAVDGTSLFDPAVKLFYNSIKQFFYLRRLRDQIWTKSSIPLEKFTLSNYFWALGVVLTRQNEVVTSESGRSVMALIPGWDMCNHEDGDRITTFSDPIKRVVSCHAKREFQANEEVKMFYGPRSNQDLLLYSGFVVDSNPYDRVIIKFKIDSSNDPLMKIRQMILQKEAQRDPYVNLVDGAVNIQVSADGSLVSHASLRVLQTLILTKDSLAKALRRSASISHEDIYEWTQDEREIMKQAFLRSCEDSERELQLQLEKTVAASRRHLFERYIRSSLLVIAAAKANMLAF